jgi:uncharacterized membrane protein YphA (DoxX/SURF4 family)
LAALFVTTGVGKLLQLPPSPENFARWGIPTAVMLAIGAAELLGGVGLLIRRVSWLAAAGLFLLMLGALKTGLVFGEPLHIALPGALLPLLAVVGVTGFKAR